MQPLTINPAKDPVLRRQGRIVPVDPSNLSDAAAVHALAWQASHQAFCSLDFIQLHTPERQAGYLKSKLDTGSRIYLLLTDEPVGIVSVTGSLIEDLYVLPERQNLGYGTELLQFAMEQCIDTPTLWILENNAGAKRLYERLGFFETGRRQIVRNGLDEIELSFEKGTNGNGTTDPRFDPRIG